MFRNPEEALVSAKPFLEKHTNEWHELWGVPKTAVTRPDFATFYREVIDAKGWQHLLFGFLASWWPLRHNDNILFLHFADMKRDHDGSIRKLSDFIGTQPTDEEWAAITEYTSFPWMKRHTVKFESSTIGAVPVLQPGAMVRKGKLGTSRLTMMWSIKDRWWSPTKDIAPSLASSAVRGKRSGERLTAFKTFVSSRSLKSPHSTTGKPSVARMSSIISASFCAARRRRARLCWSPKR